MLEQEKLKASMKTLEIARFMFNNGTTLGINRQKNDTRPNMNTHTHTKNQKPTFLERTGMTKLS